MKLRPRVEVFCFRDARVLAGFKEYVLFPGGGIDPGESALEAAKRECAEEAGRRLINCNVAHPCTMQKWPEDYTPSWGKGSNGGLTTWITASVSEDVQEDLKHPDYEPSFEWKPIRDVIERIEATMGNGWDDDNRVRLSILEAQQALRLDRTPEDEKSAGIFGYHFARNAPC